MFSIFFFINFSPSTVSAKEISLSTKDTLKAFILPHIPRELIKPEERAQYLTVHYWDKTNWRDTNYIHHPEITEQAWVNFCDLFSYVNNKTATMALQAVLKDAAEKNSEVFRYLSILSEKYFYDITSPFRNDIYWLTALDVILNAPTWSEEELFRWKEIKKMILRNNPNTKAEDFFFIEKNKNKTNLHAIKKQFVILLFHDPECSLCHTLIKEVQKSEVISAAIKNNKLKIIAVYTGIEKRRWITSKEIPTIWSDVYNEDLSIIRHSLYDLRSIPSLYLLNKEKLVLLKNTSITDIESLLQKQHTIK